MRLPRFAVVSVGFTVTDRITKVSSSLVPNGENCNLIIEVDESLDDNTAGTLMGFVLGESAILEDGRRRATDATAREATVLLRIPRAAVDEGPASFRALIFELIARTLAPRARSAR